MFPLESRPALTSGVIAPGIAGCEPPHPVTIAVAAQRLNAYLPNPKWLYFIVVPL
jgi:hypothetical protein